MSHEPLVEIVALDLMLMGSMAEMDHGEGGEVTFTVKELLVDLQRGVAGLGEKIDAKPSKEDLANLETRVGLASSALMARVVVLEAAEVNNRIKWAKVGGLAAVIGSTFGGLAATFAPHLK